MTRTIDIPRTARLALALLVFLAVIGPACLLSATEAMGMSMPSSAPAGMDCEKGGSDSLASCPHTGRVDLVSTPAPAEPAPLDFVMVTPQPVFAVAVVGQVVAHTAGTESPPPSHLTPLRL